MSNAAPAIILGLSIVTASAIYTFPVVVDWLDDRNVISTTNGSVRLGKIYNEMLKISVKIEDAKTGDVLFSVDEFADKAYMSMRSNFEKVVVEKNKEVKKGDNERFTLEGLKFKAPTIFKVKTYITYRSEHQSVFNLTVNEYEITVGDGESVNEALLKLQAHCEAMREEFLREHQMLKPV